MKRSELQAAQIMPRCPACGAYPGKRQHGSVLRIPEVEHERDCTVSRFLAQCELWRKAEAS